MQFQEKAENLRRKMRQYARRDIAVAFSGGVDSGLLLKLAVEASKEYETKVYAVLMHTMLHPAGDAEEAETAASELGAGFRVISVDELQGAGILDNPKDRCYRCKKFLFERLIQESKSLGTAVILEGTNEDDLHVYRPGLQAVKELGIISPLADAGFTKGEVRRLAGELGISASNKPSTPCLATRFPYGTRLSYEDMRRVEQGERFVRELGFYNVRLRIHGGMVRIEVDTEEFGRFMRKREKIISYLKNLGYGYVTLDLEGFRSGSMDINIDKAKK